MTKTNSKKFYTVCGANSDVPFSLDPIFLTLDDAARAVADEVNRRYEAHHMDYRVNASSCRDGFMQLISPNVVWTYKIVAHKRPWCVQYMDCDSEEQKLYIYPDKASAEAAVANKAKRVLNNLDYAEHIYADHNGDCEIECRQIKKSEPYITVDTTGGNHITWEARQL